jgi:hypothetical protein
MELRHRFGVILQEVNFGEKNSYGHFVRLAGYEETVYKLHCGNRLYERYDQHRTVYIRGYDVRLLREVRCSADDVVVARSNIDNHPFAIFATLAIYRVANNYGVCRADTSQAQLATHTTAQHLSLV